MKIWVWPGPRAWWRGGGRGCCWRCSLSVCDWARSPAPAGLHLGTKATTMMTKQAGLCWPTLSVVMLWPFLISCLLEHSCIVVQFLLLFVGVILDNYLREWRVNTWLPAYSGWITRIFKQPPPGNTLVSLRVQQGGGSPVLPDRSCRRSRRRKEARPHMTSDLFCLNPR